MRMLDLDNSGTIEEYEFLCALSMYAHGTLDEKAKLIFDLYDADKSGMLDFNELQSLMGQAYTSLQSMDGKEKPKTQDIAAKTEKVFKEIDKDGNKKISLAEWKAYIRQDS